jgi:hypothetical protein
VPPQQRRRGNQKDLPPIPREQLRQRGQDDPIGGRVAGPGHLSAQHGELVSQDRDLHVVGIGSRTATDHAEDPPQHQERQGPHHHGSRSCQARITPALSRALTLM